MSEALIFKAQDNSDLVFKYEENILKFYDNGYGPWEFDRNEAHSLMLWLEEHLAVGGGVPVTGPNYWLCGCGKYHPKDLYVNGLVNKLMQCNIK